MTIHNPPKYRYPLYDPWDRETFQFIKAIGKNKNYPSLLGSKENKNDFLISLIRTQKSLHSWRNFLKDLLVQVKRDNVINTKYLIIKYPPESISKDKPAWATYDEDKIVSDFIDELAVRKINFIGSDKEISKFVFKFLLGQLGNDWESTIMMIWEMLGNSDTLNVKELNKEMKYFDYLNIFE